MKKKRTDSDRTSGNIPQANRAASSSPFASGPASPASGNDKDELGELLDDVISPIVESKLKEILENNEGFRKGTEALEKIKAVILKIGKIESMLPDKDDIEDAIEDSKNLLRSEEFVDAQQAIMEKVDSRTTEISAKIQDINQDVTKTIDSRMTDISAKIQDIKQDITEMVGSRMTDISAKIQNINQDVTKTIDSRMTDISASIRDMKQDVTDEIDRKMDALLKEEIGKAAQQGFEKTRLLIWVLLVVSGCCLICNLILLFLYLRGQA